MIAAAGAETDGTSQQCAEGDQDTAKPRGIAVYLITWHEDNFFSYYSDLLVSLRCLYKFVLKPYGYPVVIFVQGDMPPSKEAEIRQQVPSDANVMIKRIAFDFPSVIADDPDGGVDGYMGRHCNRKSDGVNLWQNPLHNGPKRCGQTEGPDRSQD